jgi:hypothetical protein
MKCMEGRYYTIREETSLFTKGIRLILLARSRDDIYWMVTLPRYEKEFFRFQKAAFHFYWQGVVMKFIDGKIFHDKRRKLIAYKFPSSILMLPNCDDIYLTRALSR